LGVRGAQFLGGRCVVPKIYAVEGEIFGLPQIKKIASPNSFHRTSVGNYPFLTPYIPKNVFKTQGQFCTIYRKCS
jgi:hypothetical protein